MGVIDFEGDLLASASGSIPITLLLDCSIEELMNTNSLKSLVARSSNDDLSKISKVINV